MVCADLHVHCNASKRPSEWFLQKVGARESYTDVDMLYKAAKKAGMDFVTLTDHNTIEGALKLKKSFPEDTFISVEVTTYFPENNCKIHILLFDITPEQFEEADRLRSNIYMLRNYIRDNQIAYSVAHGFYSINKLLTIEILEKLMVLFDIFEGLNGARNRYYNETWHDILTKLTPEKIKWLSTRYQIEPISDTPWIKGFTGGSDDHAGLFIGQTATICKDALTKNEFIQSIRDKATCSSGRCNDYKSFAFSIYKIFCDYSAGGGKNTPGGVTSVINSVVFEDRQSRLKKWMTLRKVKKGKKATDRIILNFFEDVYRWSNDADMDVEARIDRIYDSMGLLLDEFFKMVLDSFVNDLAKGDIGKLFRNILSALPALFISVPFFSSLKHLSQDRDMIEKLKKRYIGKTDIKQKKVLWLTDTFSDLNGVSVTLNKIRKQCLDRGLNITFAVCIPDGSKFEDKPGIMPLPCIDSVTPRFYSSYTMNFPSLLASMEMIYQYRPDRIIISTPGPVGMLGMTMAAMLGIKSITVYHTDFAAQARYILKDEAVAGLIQTGINRFYSLSGHIKVPTMEYIRILADQGLDPEKMSLFKRGIDVSPLNPNPVWRKNFRREKNIKRGTTLLWAGRVSRDKNIDFLMQTYESACRMIPDLNLILCGAGPDLEYYQQQYKERDRIHFKGYIKQDELAAYYEFADLFVFPSTTDTFGMVILEAQSRGLPALVTDIGGPQEIIDNTETGFVLPLSNPDAWVNRIELIHHLKTESPNDFAMLRSRCQKHIQENFNWDEALYDILESRVSEPVQTVSEHNTFQEDPARKGTNRNHDSSGYFTKRQSA